MPDELDDGAWLGACSELLDELWVLPVRALLSDAGLDAVPDAVLDAVRLFDAVLRFDRVAAVDEFEPVAAALDE